MRWFSESPLIPSESAADYEAGVGAGIYSSTRDEGTDIPQYEVHRNGAYVVEHMGDTCNWVLIPVAVAPSIFRVRSEVIVGRRKS